MAFLKVGSEVVLKKQRLYVMEITLPSGMTVVKVGKASGLSAKERMLQICGSIYDKTRRTPMIKIHRDREVPAEYVFTFETTLHRFFKLRQYKSKLVWDGVSECFVLPLDDVIQAFDLVIEGVVPDFVYGADEKAIEDNKYGLPF
jgi:hypothetical protein